MLYGDIRIQSNSVSNLKRQSRDKLEVFFK